MQHSQQAPLDELEYVADSVSGGSRPWQFFADRVHLHPYRLPSFISTRAPEVRSLAQLLDDSWDVRRPKLIYLHIPFCSSICSYCPFTKQKENRELAVRYYEKLLRQISTIAARIGADRLSATDIPVLYVGGGSPTSLTQQELSTLLKAAKDEFKISADAEVTVELRISDLHGDYLHAIATDSPANRLSFGVQSFATERRRSLDRISSREHVIDTLQSAVAHDTAVNVDLMYGLPNQTLDEWHDEIRTALKLGVSGCSTYRLNLHSTTRFGLLERQGRLAERPASQLEYEMFEVAERLLVDESGWRPNTPANYGDPTRDEGVYNYAQLDLDYDIIGLGVGSHGQIGRNCYSSPKLVKEFLSDDRPDSDTMTAVHSLGVGFAVARDFLSLTVGRTVSAESVLQAADAARAIELMSQAGLAEIQGDDIQLTRHGMYWSRNLYYLGQRMFQRQLAP